MNRHAIRPLLDIGKRPKRTTTADYLDAIIVMIAFIAIPMMLIGWLG